MDMDIHVNKDECKCNLCVDACKRQPGWFLPGEAEQAAALLGIEWGEFQHKYIIREYWVGMTEDIYVWSPRKVGVDEGRVTAGFGSAFRRAPCIFLTTDNLCAIHAAKPAECRESMCCGPSSTWLGREYIKNEWNKVGNPLKEVTNVSETIQS